MRILIVAVSALTLLVGASCNQNEEVAANPAPDAVAAPNNEVIDTTAGAEPGAPFPGVNSYTQGQAESKLVEMGYANPTDLAQTQDGVWRGKAQKDGQTVDVAVDFQGNVTQNATR